jgi:hypothetical protein
MLEDDMSWEKTYSHTVLLALDRLGAALVFNEPDITISSLCWIVRYATKLKIAEDALPKLKLAEWQKFALTWIGNGLEYFWPGHCESARQGDVQTTFRARGLLSDLPPGYSPPA